MTLTHATTAQTEAYIAWLSHLARAASGRMHEWLTAQIAKLEGNEWGYLP